MVSRTFRLAMDLGAVCSDCGGCKSDNGEQTSACPGHGGIREIHVCCAILSPKESSNKDNCVREQTSILPLLRGSHKSLSVVFALDAVQLERTACRLVRPKSERQRMMSALCLYPQKNPQIIDKRGRTLLIKRKMYGKIKGE